MSTYGAIAGLGQLGEDAGNAFVQNQKFAVEKQNILSEVARRQAESQYNLGQLGLQQKMFEKGQWQYNPTDYMDQQGNPMPVQENKITGETRPVQLPSGAMLSKSPQALVKQYENLTGKKFADLPQEQQMMMLLLATGHNPMAGFQFLPGTDAQGNPINTLGSKFTNTAAPTANAAGGTAGRPNANVYQPFFDPRTSTMSTMVTPRYGQPQNPQQVSEVQSAINDAAQANGLDPRLLNSVISQESNFNPRAVSAKGAQGLMQLMPETSKAMGVADPFDVKQNLAGGAKYLRQMLDKYNGNPSLALAAYNAGPDAVDKAGGTIPPNPDTAAYVGRVLSNYQGGGPRMPTTFEKTPIKFDSATVQRLGALTDAKSMLTQIKTLLESPDPTTGQPYYKSNSPEGLNKVKVVISNWLYNHGISPDTAFPEDKTEQELIQTAGLEGFAAIKGLIPGIRRGDLIQQAWAHLPKGQDTAEFMHQKATDALKLYDTMQTNLLNMATANVTGNLVKGNVPAPAAINPPQQPPAKLPVEFSLSKWQRANPGNQSIASAKAAAAAAGYDVVP